MLRTALSSISALALLAACSPETAETPEAAPPALEAAAEASSTDWAYGGMVAAADPRACLLYTSPSPRDSGQSRMPSSA